MSRNRGSGASSLVEKHLALRKLELASNEASIRCRDEHESRQGKRTASAMARGARVACIEIRNELRCGRGGGRAMLGDGVGG
eukprot:767175-Hanusia_phi.AAC.16